MRTQQGPPKRRLSLRTPEEASTSSDPDRDARPGAASGRRPHCSGLLTRGLPAMWAPQRSAGCSHTAAHAPALLG